MKIINLLKIKFLIILINKIPLKYNKTVKQISIMLKHFQLKMKLTTKNNKMRKDIKHKFKNYIKILKDNNKKNKYK